MKKIYTIAIITFLLIFSGCSKDFLKSYDDRIVGEWTISKVNRVGFGGSTGNLSFREGTITFYSGGKLDYRNAENVLFKGSWNIVKKVHGDERVKSLQITAVDFTNQRVLTQYYDEMDFLGTNHFKASVTESFHNYVTHFRR